MRPRGERARYSGRMALEDVRPFAKVGVVATGLVLLALGFKLCSSGGDAGPDVACNGLPMDKINACVERVKLCSGDEAAVRECVARAVRESR